MVFAGQVVSSPPGVLVQDFERETRFRPRSPQVRVLSFPQQHIPYIHVRRKTADETVNNSDTLQDDNDLTQYVTANTTYLLSYFIKATSTAAADFKFNWSLPSGASLYGEEYVTTPSAGNVTPETREIAASGTAEGTVASIIYVALSAVLAVGSTAGQLTFQWAQNTATAVDTKVLTGSFITLEAT